MLGSEMDMAKSLHFTPVKGKPLSPFISKLKLLLSDDKYQKVIHWSERGGAILITDDEAFERQVLDESAEMFKTRNFTSFVRQLNMYGFRKVPVNGTGDPFKNMEFEHVHFKRDKPELMHLVHRTCYSRKKKRVAHQGTLTSFKRESSTQLEDPPVRKLKSSEYQKGGRISGKLRRNDSSFFSESSDSSPQKSESEGEKECSAGEFSHSSHSPFEVVPGCGGNSLLEYYYQKHQEEQIIAAQLLLNLRYSSSSPQSYENFQPTQATYEPSYTGYPMYMFPTSVPFYGQYNSMY